MTRRWWRWWSHYHPLFSILGLAAAAAEVALAAAVRIAVPQVLSQTMPLTTTMMTNMQLPRRTTGMRMTTSTQRRKPRQTESSLCFRFPAQLRRARPGFHPLHLFFFFHNVCNELEPQTYQRNGQADDQTHVQETEGQRTGVRANRNDGHATSELGAGKDGLSKVSLHLCARNQHKRQSDKSMQSRLLCQFSEP